MPAYRFAPESSRSAWRKLAWPLMPLMAALVLAGCATAPSDVPAALDTLPAQFKEQARQSLAPEDADRWVATAPAEAQPRGEWWRAFGDTRLDALVERAGTANSSVQQAAARLAQARALLRSAQADRLPQVGINSGAGREAGLESTGSSQPATVLKAGAELSYEVDLFGRLARARDAASLDAQNRAALLESVRLLAQANTAQTYLALRALDAERQLVRESVEIYRDTLRLTERRQQAGDLAELDVARAQTELAATESDALALDRQRAQYEHALAVLVGEAASGFALAEQDWDTRLPVVPPGLPASVLARRADVSAAQAAVLAAQARVGVAQAAWFPRIMLTASGGYASPDIGDLLQWSMRSWGIGALLSLPIFDGGRREAGVRQAAAQLDEALAGYRGQVLGAIAEVEDQLSSLHLLEAQARTQSRAVASARRATQLSDLRYRNGYVSQLDLLDAQRSELRNRRQALQVRSAQYQATVALVRALGGGWDPQPRQAAAAPGV